MNQTNNVPESAKPVTRRFFAQHDNLIIQMTPGTKAVGPNGLVEVEGVTIHFAGMGDGFGSYETSDPEQIKFLERHPSVFDSAEYQRRTLTPEQQIQLRDAALKSAEDEKTRLIAENNRLQALLAQKPQGAQNKEKQ